MEMEAGKPICEEASEFFLDLANREDMKYAVIQAGTTMPRLRALLAMRVPMREDDFSVFAHLSKRIAHKYNKHQISIFDMQYETDVDQFRKLFHCLIALWANRFEEEVKH